MNLLLVMDMSSMLVVVVIVSQAYAYGQTHQIMSFLVYQSYLDKANTPKGYRETCEGVEYIYYLICGIGIMGICICPDLSHYAN